MAKEERKGNQLVVTGDGSHSLFVPELGEHYHSVHGAVQESLHVFLKMGLQPLMPSAEPLAIFEVGFGTGLNALLTCEEVDRKQQKIAYTSIEAFPVKPELIEQLNYPESIADAKYATLFTELHQADWGEEIQITAQFLLHKVHAKLADFQAQDQFDLVYFDAFGPRVQPEMWSQAHLTVVYNALKPGGVLVTYCAQGQVRRDLKAVGFRVEKVPGPPGKREMMRAYRDA